METDTEMGTKIEIKSIVDARVELARRQIPQHTLAEVMGTDQFHLSRVLHGHRPLTTLLRIKIERGLNQIAQDEAEAKPEKPPQPNIRPL
jgi:plasmid maintenance system antidote protein VapI